MDTQWLANINPPSIYIALSAGVAALIWIEGQMLKKTEGKLPKSKFFKASSLIDTLWLFVSIAVVYLLDFKSIEMAVPVAYWIYALSGWVYGSRLLKRSGLPASPEELVIPKPYIAFSQSFATTFLALCVFVLLYSKPIG
ncbi:hypothetical protein [Psychrobacter phenylpyruvicus]|uniref:Uncharacterized protein n=1 Tax=Psychrobacter phenylpyruvicus TaxID=29432 RepID=A0A379LLB3_9GAMM|nr:hypothetical protein [Psychrobacter phenylpyruvicus]SUD91399.1 Uncharacterised protein [Psychrobacter phenylpyruvicus]